MLRDGDEFEVENGGQRWAASWHSGSVAPDGRAHGSAGVCVTETGGVVLISPDGESWGFPAGRPEGTENWEQTLRREVLEEACAIVTDARLLGFSRGRCIDGSELGLVLVRSIWLAKVRLLEWKPEFEIHFRRVVPATEAITEESAAFRPLWLKAFAQAHLL